MMANCFMVFILVLATAVAANPKGKFTSYRQGRILGGSNAPDGQYIYQVSLQINKRHNCGASIIDKEWIITAAHCVAGYKPSDLSVYVGSNKLSSDGTYYPIIEVHYHEQFNPASDKYDVAILKVEPITFTNKIGPIVLDNEDIGAYINCTVSGWGVDDISTGTTPGQLQHLNILTTLTALCEDQEICTVSPSGQGICFGDTGGPLVRKVDGITKQIGIASWIFLPCALGWPDGYARISFFFDWFKEKCNCI